ncbi:hypothetical protein B0J11DRAFT_542606 [Dendryphion nanum]|uniref:Uncharacterized protein n=1 Tax=Dendryphion nanum TaxID=256645 RepID=A0A9P9D547_9PLEO|nr:hypothetical protein B0J11DRAFT_542606 [Dendryphion nanum]
MKLIVACWKEGLVPATWTTLFMILVQCGPISRQMAVLRLVQKPDQEKSSANMFPSESTSTGKPSANWNAYCS